METKVSYRASNESDFIKIIPNLFNEQKRGYILLFLEKEGLSFLEKECRQFKSFGALEEAIWNTPYSKTYVAMVKDELRSIITFRGQEQVISYKLVRGSPILDFYKNKTIKSTESKISETDKLSLIEEIREFFKSLL